MLYGMISAIGVRNVVESKVDFTKSRNLIIAAVILVCGLGFSSGLTFCGGRYVHHTDRTGRGRDWRASCSTLFCPATIMCSVQMMREMDPEIWELMAKVRRKRIDFLPVH